MPEKQANLELSESERRGLLAWFANNHVAANLLMIFLILAGLLSLARIRIEIFPEMAINWITVTVPYPGGLPENAERQICEPIERAVQEVDGIRRVRSYAMEGSGVVAIELDDYIDRNKALNDVQSAVDRITTFPEQAEEPVVALATNRTQVMALAVYGDVPLRTLRELAEEIREDLTSGVAERMVMPRNWWSRLMSRIRPFKGISTVTIDGIPPYEISIEVSEQALRKYGMSFMEVAEAVRRESIDLPAGSIKTRGVEILVRTRGQRYWGRQFEQLVVRSQPDGTEILLRDVAQVKDDFEDTELYSRFNGKPAALLNVFRVGDQGALAIARVLQRYLEVKRAELPAGVHIDTLTDRSLLLKSRINLLLRNAAIGLMLVFVCLSLFLDLRLAFWTTMGIPMSFLGSFVLLPMVGVSVNMISLFAFIVVLGIVVDDAIVVGENVFAYRQKGLKPTAAAIRGVREMAVPVFLAVGTTIVAFLPLVFSAGTWGQILRVIPIVVISVLVLSLVEAMLVLPAHLSGGRLGGHGGPIARVQRLFRRMLQWVIDGPYRCVLRWAIRWRYLTVTMAAGVLMLAGGYVAGGFIQTIFFPDVEADNMVAALEMPRGTPVARTEAILQRIQAEGQKVVTQFGRRLPPGSEPLVKGVVMTVGAHPFSDQARRDSGGRSSDGTGGHLGEVSFELLDSEKRHDAQGRPLSSEQMTRLWRQRVGEIPGVVSLRFSSRLLNSGEKVNVELAHRDQAKLLAAVEELKGRLAELAGVSEIADNFVEGKPEVEVVGLTPLGRRLGLRREDLAMQVRGAFYGLEAQRVQRGRDEVKVMVRYPEAQRRSLADLDEMRLRLGGGVEVAFGDVAVTRQGRGYAVIHRTDRKRTVAVTADVDESVANSTEINNLLREEILPALSRHTPGLSWDMEGEQRERNRAMGSLQVNFVVALLAIFALLAVQFRSYIQPIIVMTAIPFGLVGALIGHKVMGIPLSFMSMFGLVALTGVVVNDSLIMIDLINRERGEGLPLLEVVEHSGTRRFRPILLTTMTTFFGLLPMVMETSLQAQFLIPMAVSLSFGVLFATLVTLLLVPALYLIVEDVRVVFAGHRPEDHLADGWPGRAGPAGAG